MKGASQVKIFYTKLDGLKLFHKGTFNLSKYKYILFQYTDNKQLDFQQNKKRINHNKLESI